MPHPPLTPAARWRIVWRGLLLLAIPVLLIAATLRDFEGAPYADDWSMPGAMYENLLRGKLSASDLWNQHNESRMLVPRLWLLATGAVWGFHSLPPVLTAFALMALALALATPLRLSDLADPEPDRWTLALLGCLLVFTPAAWEYLPWSIHLAAQLPAVGLLICLVAQRAPLSPWARSAVCAGGALLATGSFAHGILVWAFGAPFLGGLAPRAGGLRLTRADAAYLALGVLTIGLYFTNYVQPQHHPDLVRVPADLWDKGRFLLALAGAPLTLWASPPDTAALVAGAGLALLSAAAVVTALRHWRTARPEALGWLLLLLFTWTTAAAAAHGRAQFTLGFALSSRYAVLFCWIPLAALGLLWSSRGARPGFWVGVGVLGTLTVLVWPPGLRALELRQRQLRQDALTYRAAPLLPADPLGNRIVIGRARAIELLTLFRSRRWIGLEPLGDSVHTAAEQPASAQGGWYHLHPGSAPGRVRVDGWAMLPAPARDPGFVLVGRRLVDGKVEWITALALTLRRPDIGQAMQAPQLLRCGFEAEFAAPEIPGAKWILVACDESGRAAHSLQLHVP